MSPPFSLLHVDPDEMLLHCFLLCELLSPGNSNVYLCTKKYKEMLFIGLIHENIQLHYFHIFFWGGKRRKTESEEHTKLSTSPILSHLC